MRMRNQSQHVPIIPCVFHLTITMKIQHRSEYYCTVPAVNLQSPTAMWIVISYHLWKIFHNKHLNIHLIHHASLARYNWPCMFACLQDTLFLNPDVKFLYHNHPQGITTVNFPVMLYYYLNPSQPSPVSYLRLALQFAVSKGWRHPRIISFSSDG